jgi:MtN3 and saliva related transmembrane protein
MQVTLTEWTGYLAAALTTVSFIPQVIKIYKTQETAGISLVMYLVFVSGIIMWLLYGFFLDELPIILANSVTLLLSGYILFMKVTEGRREKRI